MRENQENSAYHFKDNYLVNQICKIGLNPEELEPLD